MKKIGTVARLLILTGVVLLATGAALAYPYAHSRLARPPSARVLTPTTELGSPTPESPEEPAEPQSSKAPLPTQEPPVSPSPEAAYSPAPSVTEEPGHSEPPGPRVVPPDRIVIPTLDLDGPVVPVSLERSEVGSEVEVTWQVPDEYAAGWHDTSALLGESGNIVLNGHNTTRGEIFRDLYTLKVDDEIILHAGEISRTYAVSVTLILPEAGQPLEVRRANARYVMATDHERLTLVTCHPYGSLRNRLIVIAMPSQSDPVVEPSEVR